MLQHPVSAQLQPECAQGTQRSIALPSARSGPGYIPSEVLAAPPLAVLPPPVLEASKLPKMHGALNEG